MRVVLCAVVLALALTPQSPAPGSPRIVQSGAIETGKPVEVSLKLMAGEIVHVRAEQQGVNLVLSLHDSSGKDLSTVDIFASGHVEHLVAPAAADAAYTLRLRAAGEQTSGSFRLTVDVRANAPARSLAEGFALLAQGARAQGSGDQKTAIARVDSAAAKLAGLQVPELEAKAAHLAGGARFFSGDQAGARTMLIKSLAIAREAGLRRQEADTLETLSRSLLVAGDAQQSRDAIEDAIVIVRQLGDRFREAGMVNAQALIYRETGDPERALSILLPAISGLDNRFSTTRALLQLTAGGIHMRLRNPAKAIEQLLPALEHYRKTNNAQGVANTSTTLGVSYSDMQRHEEAVEAFESALKIHRSRGGHAEAAVALHNLGREKYKQGRLSDAARILSEALEGLRAAGNRDLEASCLNHMAVVERGRGNLDAALGLVQSAVQISLASRRGLRTPASRAGYLASRGQFFEVRTDVLMDFHARQPDGGHAARALTAINETKARGLFEMLADDSATPVSEQTLALEAEINRLERERVASGSSPAKAADLGRQVTERIVELENVRRPRTTMAASAGPRALTPEAMRQLLDPGTAMLQYGYGQEQIYAWLLTSEGLEPFSAGRRADLEPQSRRAYQLLTARGEGHRDETAARRRERIMAADAELDAVLETIAAALLGPVRAKIGGKRLVIVADGVLQYLPFAALPVPGRPGTTLAAEHEIAYLPSVSVLEALRQASTRRQPAPLPLALFADPVFRGDDARIRNSPAAALPSQDDVTRSARESGIESFRRLRFSRQEAETIAALVPSAGALKALDFAASRQTLLATDLARYRILHFATHGLVNHVHPELSGLVLSLVDEQGRPREGFLRLHEIFGLRLGADLVTLSACQTALGRELRGEGLAGLSQGFLAAGASRVLASLWNVDDRATAELMKHFYAAYLKRGIPPAAALRSAQLELRQDPRWKSPYYWAGFVLQGDWR